MKSVIAGALLAASLVSANQKIHEHLQHLHKRHHDQIARSTQETAEQGVEIRSAAPETDAPEVEKRGGQCAFPYDAGLVAVTPGSQNAGWAMSPDQPCKPGNYCPYACPPGQVSMQWDASATSYSYPQSMNGGLFCDSNGNIQKPFPDKPYCQSTSSNIGVVNNAGGVVSFCQTVLPGNEAMLIPTTVDGFATLANPGTDYWCRTAAHYYINPPGVGPDDGCIWGSPANPHGNWAAYVAGANTDASGQTFIKLGWNPIYLEPATPFRNQMPDWGVEIDCPNGGCNGLPCAIDPSKNKVNEMQGSASNGAGGGAFCVVTVQPGSQANFVITGGSGNRNQWNDWGHGGQFYQSSSSSSSGSSSSTTSFSATTTAWTANATTTGYGNSTSTTYGPGSSHHPYSSLFNTDTATSTPTAAPTAQQSSSPVAPTLAVATGIASSQRWSIAGLAVGLFAAAMTQL